MATRQEATYALIQESLVQLLETTFGEKPEILPQAETGIESKTQAIASIGLSGSLDASLAIGLSQNGACLLVSKMLGTEIKEFNQDVVDGTGELANILAGLIKTKFAELGCVFNLSLPAVITASVALSLRQLVKAEGVVLSAKVMGIAVDVYFFYSRSSAGLVSLSDIIAKTQEEASEDAAETLKKLLIQKPKKL